MLRVRRGRVTVPSLLPGPTDTYVFLVVDRPSGFCTLVPTVMVESAVLPEVMTTTAHVTTTDPCGYESSPHDSVGTGETRITSPNARAPLPGGGREQLLRAAVTSRSSSISGKTFNRFSSSAFYI
jgi:hypothetical protein